MSSNRKSDIVYVCIHMPLYLCVMGWHISGICNRAETKTPQLASFVLEAHMVMFNSFASHKRVKELFISCERVSATIVCMCELGLLSQFHGLFISTFHLGCQQQQCGWM